jgi:hypothetical protein
MTEVPFAPTRRMTLWIPSTGPSHDPARGHLFIVLTNPCPSGMVLLVPVCGAGPRSDTTCLLGVGDHPFLTKKSFVAYHLLKTYAAVTLVEQARKKIIQGREMLDERIFALVCRGVETSRSSPPIYKRYFAEQTEPKPTIETKS